MRTVQPISSGRECGPDSLTGNFSDCFRHDETNKRTFLASQQPDMEISFRFDMELILALQFVAGFERSARGRDKKNLYQQIKGLTRRINATV